MKNLKSILLVSMFAFIAISCSKNEEPQLQPLEAKTITNIHAPGDGRGSYTGAFTKFSFKEGKKVTGDNWDIAFRATEIIVNGGKKGALLEDIDRKGNASLLLLSEKTFNDVVKAPSDVEFKQDKPNELVIKTGSKKGWYTYDFANHKIVPTPGKIILVKTIDGNYVKMEISSYYKDNNPSQATSQYYTFNYKYNPNVGDKNLQ